MKRNEIGKVMETEYRVSTIERWFNAILAIFLSGGLMFLFCALLVMKRTTPIPILFFLPFFSVSLLLLFVNSSVKRVIVSDHSILFVSLFTRKELNLSSIKGYRAEDNTLIIEACSAGDPTILVRKYNDLSKSNQLIEWLAARFTDLNALDLKEEKESVLQSEDWGDNQKEREENLLKVRRITIGYNILAILLSAVVFITRASAGIKMLLFVPLAGILLLLIGKGMIKLVSNSSRSVYPYVWLGLGISCFAVGSTSIAYYNLVENGPLWRPAWIVSGCVLLLFVRSLLYESKSAGKPYLPIRTQIVIVIALSLSYGFGTVVHVNCGYDRSSPQVFDAAVLGHRISHGKHTNYILTISPWGPRQNEEEVDVSESLYYNTAIGDTVNVECRPGLLHIPWYRVRKR